MDVNRLSRLLTSGDSSPKPSLVRSSLAKPSFAHAPPSSSADTLSSSPEASKAQAVEVLEKAVVHSLPPFTPYSAQVPWHTGMRALFSQMFPKYGRYCGPNWSSGRSSGSTFWDKPPIDWLDHCCYCHDIGYDSFDQAQLYKADIELLECLQKMPPPKQQGQNEKGLSLGNHETSNENVAWFYRNLYITGLQAFVLPYRRLLLRDMRGAQPQE